MKISSQVFIAAEIGINHNGDMDLAKKMIRSIKECGADAVKFQNYRTQDFILDKTISYTYKSNGKEFTEKQFDMFKRYELSFDQIVMLKKYCDDLDIIFFSTPTSKEGIDQLKKLGVSLIKNGSDFLQNLPFIKDLAKSQIPTVLSTGMASLAHIDEAVRTFENAGGKDLTILQCVSQYPTPLEEVNLLKLPVLKKAFGYPVGFSDHTEGNIAAIGAVTLGAVFIEKHFTLSRELEGPDHQLSSTPSEFALYVDSIRKIEKALGSEKLVSTLKDQKNGTQFQLSCVANKEILPGQVLRDSDISFSRPGNGLPPKMKQFLIGKKLLNRKKIGSKFTFDDFI
jgi:N-acetylneuraminate synthase/N,N'-diacetyllegionaminate synthase